MIVYLLSGSIVDNWGSMMLTRPGMAPVLVVYNKLLQI